MKIIKSRKDIADLKFGDEYIIDVFPDVGDQDQEITEKMFNRRNRIQAAIEDMFRPKEKKDKDNNPNENSEK